MAKKRPTRSEEESYRLYFFIISQLLMLSMVWLLYQEFFSRRPWKDIQLGWFQVEKARAVKNLESEKKYLKSGTMTVMVDGEEEDVSVPERVKVLKAKVEELDGAIINTPKRVEYERLKGDLAAAEIKVGDREMDLAFAKAAEDELYYYYRAAKHHGHGYEKEKKAYDEAHEAAMAADKKYNAAVKKRDALMDQTNGILKELTAAKKELADFKATLTTAQRAVDATEERWTGIEQFWNQEIDLVDRCHTCHFAYDKCGFTDPEEILHYTLEEKLTAKDLKTRFCLTREEIERYLEVAEEVRDSWFEEEKLTYEDVKEKLITVGSPEAKKMVTEPVLATAKKLKAETNEAEKLYRTHPNYWHLIRKHPVQTYGCTTCHYGQGRQTKGVGLNYLAAYLWNRENGKNLSPFDHATSDHYWVEQILDNKQNHTEASCFNCHADDYELEYAPNLTNARKTVQHLGCTGCHPLGKIDGERKHGPTLKKIATKADPGWLYEWIKYPRSLRPRTRMPNFWPNAVTKDGKVDKNRKDCAQFNYEKGAPFAPAKWVNCAEQRDEEAAYILAYILKQSESPEYPQMPSSANAERGKELFEEVGCRGCHNMAEWKQASHMPGDVDRDLAPNLTHIGDKLTNPGWIFNWVKNPKSYWHETRMPSLRLTDQEAWDITAYLTGDKSGTQRTISASAKAKMEDSSAAKKGEKLANYYGCSGCHSLKGYENAPRIGADLTLFGSKLASKLDFGDVQHLVEDPHEQNWDNWTHLKLKAPRSYTYERAVTKMPQFDVTEAERKMIVLFLKSQNEMAQDYPEHVKHMPDEKDKAIQRGAFLIDVYNCGGCHLIDKRGIDIDGDHALDGGDIYRLYAGTDDQYRAPPKLIRQGSKVYPDWFFKFLKEPFKLRENFKIRMPTFQFTDEQASEIVAYFAAKAGTGYPFIKKKQDMLSAADQELAGKLFTEAQCLNCHALGSAESTDPKNVAPNLLLTADRLQYDWLFHWLKNPQEQQPGVGMPNFFAANEDKPGEYETPLTDLADGDWRRQIRLLRAYVINLGLDAKKQAQAPAEEEPAPKKRRKRRGG